MSESNGAVVAREEQPPQSVPAPRGTPLPEVDIVVSNKKSDGSTPLAIGRGTMYVTIQVFGEIEESASDLRHDLALAAYTQTKVTHTLAAADVGGIWRWELVSVNRDKSNKNMIVSAKFRRYGWRPSGANRARDSVRA